jgi:protein-L-isoaspartate(D-aspartate) O-methyltransferase
MSSSDVFTAARRHMVDSQLRPTKVNDPRVIDAMGAVPREQFVPKAFRGVAYMDEDIAVAPGRYLLEPIVLARLLQAAEIEPGEVVLVVGVATGYSAAVASRLAGTVVALESDADLARQANANLAATSVHNAAVITGPLAAGLPAQGPFNVILLDGAVEEIPEALMRQLAEGGRLLGVVVEDGVGDAVLVRRTGDAFARRGLFNAQVRPLLGFGRERGFVF